MKCNSRVGLPRSKFAKRSEHIDIDGASKVQKYTNDFANERSDFGRDRERVVVRRELRFLTADYGFKHKWRTSEFAGANYMETLECRFYISGHTKGDDTCGFIVLNSNPYIFRVRRVCFEKVLLTISGKRYSTSSMCLYLMAKSSTTRVK